MTTNLEKLLKDMSNSVAFLSKRMRDIEVKIRSEPPLTDYFAASTKVGWTSYIVSNLKYKRNSGLLHVFFYIYGVSNNTVTSVTLPDINASGFYIYAPFRAIDNGAPSVIGLAYINAASNVLAFLSTEAGGAWTASGNKAIFGQITVPV
jgi:hypothetical protein